jgi:hypothetical protein
MWRLQRGRSSRPQAPHFARTSHDEPCPKGTLARAARHRRAGASGWELDEEREGKERVVVAFSWNAPDGSRTRWAPLLTMRDGRIVRMEDYAVRSVRCGRPGPSALEGAVRSSRSANEDDMRRRAVWFVTVALASAALSRTHVEDGAARYAGLSDT